RAEGGPGARVLRRQDERGGCGDGGHPARHREDTDQDRADAPARSDEGGGEQMTCEEVRNLLPEHVLGSRGGGEDVAASQPLRGCASCRAESAGLGEGMVLSPGASRDRRPPAELRDRVLTVLEEEWRDAPRSEGPSARWKAVVAMAA